MTKDEMIKWYYGQSEKDSSRNFGDNLKDGDIRVLMQMWHNQEVEYRDNKMRDALQEILSELPDNPKLPLVWSIKNIAENGLK